MEEEKINRMKKVEKEINMLQKKIDNIFEIHANDETKELVAMDIVELIIDYKNEAEFRLIKKLGEKL